MHNESRLTIILDTCVVVRALIGSERSSSNVLLQLALKGFVEYVYSQTTWQELINAITYKHIQKRIHEPHTVKQLLTMLHRYAIMVEPTRKITISRDNKDNQILEACTSYAVHYIVTFDDDLLVLHNFEKTKIVLPRELLHNLGGNSN